MSALRGVFLALPLFILLALTSISLVAADEPTRLLTEIGSHVDAHGWGGSLALYQSKYPSMRRLAPSRPGFDEYAVFNRDNYRVALVFRERRLVAVYRAVAGWTRPLEAERAWYQALAHQTKSRGPDSLPDLLVEDLPSGGIWKGKISYMISQVSYSPIELRTEYVSPKWAESWTRISMQTAKRF